MTHFRSVKIIRRQEGVFVRVGGGCQIKHLLAELQKHGLTLPTVGLITEQTIAGATATGTHGSGKQSLSHFIQSVRVACYDDSNQAIIKEIKAGPELLAARCNLGCLGVVLTIELPCVEQYNVLESVRFCDSVEQALASEEQSPLQQFFLFPHRFDFAVQQRQATDRPRSRTAFLYRMYWWVALDVLFHLILKLFVSVLRSRFLVTALYRYLFPIFVIRNWKVIDRSDKMLVMEHELFRHLELEAFVPKEQVVDAAKFVELVLKQADGNYQIDVPEDIRRRLEETNLLAGFQRLKSKFSHHYPICFRRILRDDTLISMASGDSKWWYSISFITYLTPRDEFFQLATFLAKSLTALYGGRIHWGKWFPLDELTIEKSYPRIGEFRKICSKNDPNQVFQNKFTELICPPVSKLQDRRTADSSREMADTNLPQHSKA